MPHSLKNNFIQLIQVRHLVRSICFDQFHEKKHLQGIPYLNKDDVNRLDSLILIVCRMIHLTKQLFNSKNFFMNNLWYFTFSI